MANVNVGHKKTNKAWEREVFICRTLSMPKRYGNHLLACQQFLTKSHIVTRFTIERASLLNINDINDISFFGTFDCYQMLSLLFYSVSVNANSMM
jgi:hypothetical protein